MRHGAILGWAAGHLEGDSQNLAGIFLHNSILHVHTIHVIKRKSSVLAFPVARRGRRRPPRGPDARHHAPPQARLPRHSPRPLAAAGGDVQEGGGEDCLGGRGRRRREAAAAGRATANS